MTNTLRKIALVAMLAATAGTTMTMTSCKKDDATCETGYEGTDCKTEVRAKFINASGWSAEEVGSVSKASTFGVNIKTSSTGVDKILISNLYNEFGNDVVATVSGTTFTIARQEPDGDKFFVQGNGSFNGTSITVDYTVTDERTAVVISDRVTGTWTKK